MSDVTKTDLMRLSARITDAETDIAAIEAASSGLTPAQVTDLTDAGESALHYHSSDRARANHTGTQAAATISDFDTEVGNNTTVTGKIDKATNVTAINDTGIADGEIALFNLTNKDIRTSDKTIVTSLGADDTTVPTSKAVKDVTDGKAATSHTQAETTITFTDVSTNDTSTTAHGYAPKAVAPDAGLVNVLGIANGETVITNKPLFDATAPSTQAFGDSASAGTATVSARRDHKHEMMATPSATTVGLGNVTNDAQITKATLTAKGSIIAASAASTPAEITVGTDGKYLKADSAAAGGVSWDTPAGAGTGDVVGPATHAASYVPLWNTTPDSKTLVEGKALTGVDATIVSGTKGATGSLAMWDANGDVIDYNGEVYATLKTKPNAAMTSNSSQGCVALASSEFSSSYPAWRAFNKTYSDDNSWASTAADSNRWLQLRITDIKVKISTMQIANRTRGSLVNGIVDFTISGSNNGTDFTQLLAVTGRDGTTSGLLTTHTINSTVGYEYFRINISNPGSGATYACIGEVYIDGLGQVIV